MRRLAIIVLIMGMVACATTGPAPVSPEPEAQEEKAEEEDYSGSGVAGKYLLRGLQSVFFGLIEKGLF